MLLFEPIVGTSVNPAPATKKLLYITIYYWYGAESRDYNLLNNCCVHCRIEVTLSAS